MILALLMACGDINLEPLFLTSEFYEWRCEEKSESYPVDKVVVSTQTCAEGVHWIVSELHYTTGQFMKQSLRKEECFWQAEYPLIKADCDDVAGVALTAWVDPATWASVTFGDDNDS